MSKWSGLACGPLHMEGVQGVVDDGDRGKAGKNTAGKQEGLNPHVKAKETSTPASFSTPPPGAGAGKLSQGEIIGSLGTGCLSTLCESPKACFYFALRSRCSCAPTR